MSVVRRHTVLGALAAAVVAAAIVVATGSGDSGYRISIPVPNASGLRNGSAVKVGGLDRGTVHLKIDKRDRVILQLDLDKSVGKVGTDAKVAIVAANFLGIKRVELDPGHPARGAAPDGYVLPATRLTTPTDLDQVLDVFDADTRTRAKILLNALGAAVVGRRVDVSTLLKELPVGMEQAAPALQQLTTDDRTMTDLVSRSDRFVAQVTAQRRSLDRLIDTLGQTSTTVVARRAALQRTLAEAPGTLRSLRGFLDDLQATASDLGPAAREISAAAPSLRNTLAEVDGFRRAAAPTLATATAAAPDLTRLATGATPVLRRLRPTLGSAAALANALPPVSHALDNSADNIIAILENWSRAIQFRDQLGHVFRGEASFSPDLILTMVDRLTKNSARKRPAPAKPDRTAPAPAATPKLPTVTVPGVPKVKDLVDQVVKTPVVGAVTTAVGDLVNGLGGGTAHDKGDGTKGILDYLLKP